ncbi:FUSC family protein [Acinetobacter bouvetii]|uniref:FUSC family protein n=1 Tax=Acinetobacter bouvetii TaxID=202951 RepID=A0A811G680_9GAMM|nr:FUSC family protein [Acinetobacter bouvetii]CAB1208449.1 hypothetical protein SFB21_0419 [Acinetobacter bouvetii]
MHPKDRANTLYVVKILSCAVAIVVLALIFDKDKDTNFFLWASLTAFFTIQHDLNQKINFNQVTGNFIGSLVGILIWLGMAQASFLHMYYINLEYLFFVLGIFLTTLICVSCRATQYTGIALSSFMIVSVYDFGHHTIDGALLRIVYCLVGCLIAYAVEYCCQRFIQDKWFKAS